ncbi:C-terminal binding protein [Chloroflexota bacterium]
MGFKVAMVVNPVMLAKNMPDSVKGTGAEVSMHTSAETEDELISICRDADCIITHQGFFPFTPKVFQGLPNCRFLITASIGFDALDVKAAAEQGIGVVNLRGFCSEELAEHAMALMLSSARWIVKLHNRAKAGGPIPRPSDEANQYMRILRGKTLGLLGFGNAGRLMVPKGRGFEMDIIAYDPYVGKDVFKEMNVRQVSLDELCQESDFISVHANLTEENRHIMSVEQFKKMKPNAYIVNTARGGIIEEKALMAALDAGYLAGAGLDVTEQEPIPSDSPLFNYENIIVTGHRAGSSPESTIIWGRQPAEEVARIMAGEWPLGLVNPEVKEKFVAKWGEMKEPECG